MTDSTDKKPAAQIFKKPAHDRATRKVSALPELIKKSERPDGERPDVVDEPNTAEMPEDVSASDSSLFDDLFDEDMFDDLDNI